MKITPEEAKESLTSVRTVMQRTRRAMNVGGSAYYLLIWGMVWLLGFLAIYFLLPVYSMLVGWVWLFLDVGGIVASAWVSIRSARRIRDPFGKRFAFFWLALILFSLLWLWIARPTNMAQTSLLIITFAMFGYTVMGIWLEKLFVAVAIMVIGLALISYFLIPTFFALWMAILGGGTLIGSSIYILRRW